MSGRRYDRRHIAGGIAAAALLPFAALGAPLSAARAAPGPRTAPAGRFTLQRVLTRELVDGAAIVVTRRWRIGFAAAGHRLVVSGEQIFADVAAPPTLAPLAALEKARPTGAMFPLELDESGHIAGSMRRMDAAQLLRAIETGGVMFEQGPGGPSMVAESRAFMAQLSRLGAEAVSTVPRDLFFPTPVRSAATRNIDLPGGATGIVSVTSEASVDPSIGLLSASERIIVTRIGDSERTSREAWSMTRRT